MKTYSEKSVANRSMCKFGKKSFVKRTLAAVLSAGMLFSGMPAVFGEAYKAPDSVVDYFETFHGFEQNGGSYFAGAKLPEGWATANYTDNRAWRISGYSDENGTGSNIIKATDSTIIYKFDEAIKDGILHISFDAKMDDAAMVNVGGFNTSVNDNPNDYWNEEKNYYTYSYFLKTKKITEGELTVKKLALPKFAASNEDEAVANADTAWHKYDVYINFDEDYNDDNSHGSFEVYQDGELLGKRPMTSPNGMQSYNGIKALFINHPWISDALPCGYFDNFYIHHYKTTEENTYEAPRIAIDYDNSGIDPNNGTVDVVFSEALNDDTEFMLTQFTIKNMATGETKSPVTVEAIPQTTGARLTLPKLDEGEYEISVKNILGSKSQKAVSNTVKFNISGGGKIGESQRMYMNENFNTYKGGMPAEFDAAQFTDYNDVFAEKLTMEAKESDNDKAIKVGDAENERNIEYKFNNPISSGKFTVEFDVKNNGNKWGVGLMSAGDFFKDTDYMEYYSYEQTENDVMYTKWKEGHDAGTITDEWSVWATANKKSEFINWQKAEDTKADWLAKKQANVTERKNKNLLIGNTGGDAVANTAIYSAKAKSKKGTDLLNNVTAALNEWTHVKAVVDLDGGKYYFYIDESSTPVVLEYNLPTSENDTYKNGRITRDEFYNSLNSEKAPYKYMYGMQGIRLQGCGAQFDNIKVYTDKSYNDYQNFDGQGNKVSQPGWYWGEKSAVNYKYEGHRPEKRIEADSGRSGQTDDKAMKITADSTYYYVHPLAVPIKAGKSFDVEFDVKADLTDKGIWMFGLMEEEYMQQNGANTLPGNTAANGEAGTLTLSDDQFKYRAFIENNGGRTKGQLGVVNYGGNIYNGNTAAKDTSGNVIKFNNNEWSKVKLSLVPYYGSDNVAKARFTVSVTDKDGKTVTSETQWMYDSAGYAKTARFYNKDTYGCVFMTNGDVTIDNLKITETGDIYKAAVTSVKTKDQMGKDVDLTDKVYANDGETPEINIQFSDTLNNTDDIKDVIKVYYPETQESTAPEYNVTVSDDKKSAKVTLTNYEEDKNITLYVSNNASIGSSYLSAIDTTSKTFTVTQPEDKLEITDFRLYKNVEGRSNGKYTCDGALVPVTDTNIGNKAFNNYKLVVKGYNSGSAKDISIITAIYGSDSADLLSGIVNETINIPVGEFEKEYTITSTDENSAKLKAFVWDMEGGLMPLWENLEYTRTVETSV